MGEPLGLESKTVRVVPYDTRWPALLRAEAVRLAEAVAAAGLPALSFEHVGSTSVPGLAARYPHDREAYIAGKSTFVEAVVRAGARARGGWPSGA